MPTLQDFFADSTAKAAADLEKAFLRLPQDKRITNCGGDSRTPIDQVAECAILNGTTAGILATQSFPADFDFAGFEQAKKDLAQDWEGLKALFDENTSLAAAAIRAVPDEALDAEIAMPWGPMKISQIIAYPYWNMTYHEGQINYIAAVHQVSAGDAPAE